MPTDNEPMAGDVYRRNGNWRQFHGVDSEGNVLFFTFGEQGVRKCGSAEWREWSRDATRVWPLAAVQPRDMTNQPTPTTTELAARLREQDYWYRTGDDNREKFDQVAATKDAKRAADELERLTAEVERLSGLIHSCPKCGEFCKQCRCWNDELAEARAIILEGGFNPRQRADDYHLRRDAFLASTATAEGE
jgi:hypothetical protein